MITMRLIGYIRVSTKGQVDRYGLDAQRSDLERYAASHGITLVSIETEPARSGSLPADQRPALLTCLKAIRDGDADGLLLPNLDRLARQLTVQEAVLAQVWDRGGIVHTVESPDGGPGGEVLQDDPDDPMRTAIRQMRGVFAQLERAMIAKRMRNGRKVKRDQGGYAGDGSPPYGMRSVDGELMPDPDELAVIQGIRRMRAGGASLRDIAGRLQADGVPTPYSRRNGTFPKWGPQTVSNILSRP